MVGIFHCHVSLLPGRYIDPSTKPRYTDPAQQVFRGLGPRKPKTRRFSRRSDKLPLSKAFVKDGGTWKKKRIALYKGGATRTKTFKCKKFQDKFIYKYIFKGMKRARIIDAQNKFWTYDEIRLIYVGGLSVSLSIL